MSIHAELCVLVRGMLGRGRSLGPTRLGFMVSRGFAAIEPVRKGVGLYADWLYYYTAALRTSAVPPIEASLAGGRYLYMDDLRALEQVSAHGGPPLAIVTPYVLTEWDRLLAAHPDRDFVAYKYIVRGIRSGFQIGVDHSLLFRSVSSNMHSARENAPVIDDYLRAECR